MEHKYVSQTNGTPSIQAGNQVHSCTVPKLPHASLHHIIINHSGRLPTRASHSTLARRPHGSAVRTNVGLSS